MGVSKQSSGSLKTRVNICLNKLSDRDTLSMATNELEGIARALSSDDFVPFLNCISTTDSSEKSPVRRQCVRVFSILSAAHGDALSPHVSRMISAVLRRLRDPDSAVRAACVDAISSITTNVTQPPFSVILKPLVDALFQEQDSNAQMGVALCVSAAVDAAREVDASELRKLLPRVLKLIKKDCFKAKPSLLVLTGSIVDTCCVKNKSLLSSLVYTAVEFLSSEDWAARKAAADVLEKAAATADKDLAAEFKGSCVAALESRRFDKVKVTRETMNQALERWRDVPDVLEEVTSPKGSSCSSSGYSPVLVSRSVSADRGSVTPQFKKVTPTKSPVSSCSSTGRSQKSIVRNDQEKKPCTSNPNMPELRRNFRSRVVPFNFNSDDLDVGYGDSIHEKLGTQTEFEDLSLICDQLVQIENQQSTLLDILQKFIGSSQKGLNSLEKRVEGLEKVVDEMSQDLAIPGTWNYM
ncbi:TORTIFOLIA1-like protein 4 isoform X2 [Primulina eburnea]|uniref:TORTIFOLIA1-like protein 4 isoform X2 n=1 Tax=Primulina eburnea TaxID=1245227 RepID=UPI003C6BF4E4